VVLSKLKHWKTGIFGFNVRLSDDVDANDCNLIKRILYIEKYISNVYLNFSDFRTYRTTYNLQMLQYTGVFLLINLSHL
jgi:hypothetical protein